MSPRNDEIPRVGRDSIQIRIRTLSKWYGDVIGLNDLDLDIGRGVFGLLGPNGAGKSTLLKLLTGQLNPSRGNVQIQGQSLRESYSLYDKIGYVPQEEVLYEKITGESFIEDLVRLNGFNRDEIERRTEDVLKDVELFDQKDRRIKTYSKGMRQRLKLAQALVHDPDIMFLDEPLTGTDPVGRRVMIDKIRAFDDQGKTVIVSSHVLHEIEQMTNNILLIHNGRLLADGDIHQIRELIEEHPHTILLECENPRDFGAKLFEESDVSNLEIRDGKLFISTQNPSRTYSRIATLATRDGYTIKGMTSPDDNLESLFEYLVEDY